jgi:hypothetical protein
MAVPHNCIRSIARERVCVAPHRRRGGEVCGGAARNGMTPIRCDFGQGAHDEQALCGARVRQNELRRRQNFATKGDEIEIKRSWRIRNAALAAELAFNLL